MISQSQLCPTTDMWDSQHLGLSKYNSRDNNSPVTLVSLCAYANENNEGDENGRPPTNYWAAYLEISESKSVMLDMIPGDGSDGLTGMLIIESNPCLDTDKVIFKLTFPIIGCPTVDNLISLLIQKGGDRYKFTEAQQGCRYWNYTAVAQWESAGWLETGSADTAYLALSYYYRYPSGRDGNSMDIGTFY
jgi:hypothetical protein